MSTPSTAPPESKLRALYDKHRGNIVRVAEELNRPRQSVDQWIRKLNLKGRGKGGIASESPSEDELYDLYKKFKGNFSHIAAELGRNRNVVAVWYRKLGMSGQGVGGQEAYQSVYPQVIATDLDDGYVVCFSDAHLWFEEKSRAHQALIVALKKLKPAIVIADGDIVDGARVSRHDASGIDPTPTFEDELEIAVRHMAEIRRLTPDAEHYFPLGNHDTRPYRYLAKNADAMSGVEGTRLDHHILGWQFCMAVTIGDSVIVKHFSGKGGVHATRNNSLNDGRTTVNGHLHSQKVTPITDARGTRWGVDLGCLADPDWPQFNYTNANTKDWRSGFGVLEFRDGKLLPPMLATVLDDGSVWMQRNEKLI